MKNNLMAFLGQWLIVVTIVYAGFAYFLKWPGEYVLIAIIGYPVVFAIYQIVKKIRENFKKEN